jgi:hypothetical protein
MVQLFVTVALTPRFAVAVAADVAGPKAAAAIAAPLNAATPRNLFARIAFPRPSPVRLFMTPAASRSLYGTLWYSMALHGRGQRILEMRHWHQAAYLQLFTVRNVEIVILNGTQQSALF